MDLRIPGGGGGVPGGVRDGDPLAGGGVPGGVRDGDVFRLGVLGGLLTGLLTGVRFGVWFFANGVLLAKGVVLTGELPLDEVPVRAVGLVLIVLTGELPLLPDLLEEEDPPEPRPAGDADTRLVSPSPGSLGGLFGDVNLDDGSPGVTLGALFICNCGSTVEKGGGG